MRSGSVARFAGALLFVGSMPGAGQAPTAGGFADVGGGLSSGTGTRPTAMSLNVNYETLMASIQAYAYTTPSIDAARRSAGGATVRYGGLARGWSPQVEGGLSAAAPSGGAFGSRADLRVGAVWADDVTRLSLDGGASHYGGERATNGAMTAEIALRRQVGSLGVTIADDLAAFSGLGLLQRDTTYVVAGFPFHQTLSRTGRVQSSTSDLTMNVLWSLRRASVEWSAGVRTAKKAAGDRWTSASGAIPLIGRVALVVSAGKRPASPEQRLPAWRFATLGFRVSQAFASSAAPAPTDHAATANAPQLSVVPDSTRGARFEIHVRGATRVEVKGDFTDWLPVTLERDVDRSWRTGLVAPGLHRILVRVDRGDWMAPANLITELSEFGDQVGLVLVGP